MAPVAVAVPLADDALLFARYANQFLAGNGFSWNPGESPSFGNTSQLYQFMVTAIQTVLDNPVQAVALSARASALIAATAVLGLVLREANSAEPRLGRGAAALLILFGAVGFALNPDFAAVARTGMDTTTAAALVALYIVLAEHANAKRRPWRLCAVLSVGGWLLVLARPELGLLSAAVPLALAAGDSRLRRPALASLALLSVLLGGSLGLAWLYYGTPLPLAFYVKSLGISPYAEGAVAEYGFGNVAELLRLIRNNAALLVPLLAFARVAFFSRPLWWGLLAGTAAVLFYETFLNALPIGNGGMRFFLPILPVLVLAAVKSAGAALATGRRAALPVVAACLALQAIVSAPRYVADLAAEARQAAAVDSAGTPRAMLLANWRERQRHKWIGLDRMAELEPNCLIATTELGVIGALYPSRPLLDLSGLANPLLRQGLDRQWLFEEARPDVIFTDPLVSYWGIDLAKDPEFLGRYVYFPRSALNGYDAFAVRRDSACGRHFAAMIAEELTRPSAGLP